VDEPREQTRTDGDGDVVGAPRSMAKAISLLGGLGWLNLPARATNLVVGDQPVRPSGTGPTTVVVLQSLLVDADVDTRRVPERRRG